jgi:hypothetical protein
MDPEECTVGALRRKAAGHDVSIQSKGMGRSSTHRTLASDLGRMSSRSE